MKTKNLQKKKKIPLWHLCEGGQITLEKDFSFSTFQHRNNAMDRWIKIIRKEKEKKRNPKVRMI